LKPLAPDLALNPFFSSNMYTKL